MKECKICGDKFQSGKTSELLISNICETCRNKLTEELFKFGYFDSKLPGNDKVTEEEKMARKPFIL